jgi:hypothetical protein
MTKSIKSLYSSIGLNENSFPLSIRMRKAKNYFLIAFTLWICWCLALWRLIYSLMPLSPKSAIEPPLNGSAQFAVLGLAVALSVYLRQVRANALDLRDKIRGGQVWNYPLEERHSEWKMEALDSMAEKLAFAGPFLIWLFVPVSCRIILEILLQLFAKQPLNALFALDFVIGQWFFFAFIGLAVAHYISRRRDDKLRIAARFREDVLKPIPPKSQAAKF